MLELVGFKHGILLVYGYRPVGPLILWSYNKEKVMLVSRMCLLLKCKSYMRC